jgi:hypothetical protein
MPRRLKGTARNRCHTSLLQKREREMLIIVRDGRDISKSVKCSRWGQARHALDRVEPRNDEITPRNIGRAPIV